MTNMTALEYLEYIDVILQRMIMALPTAQPANLQNMAEDLSHIRIGLQKLPAKFHVDVHDRVAALEALHLGQR